MIPVRQLWQLQVYPSSLAWACFGSLLLSTRAQRAPVTLSTSSSLSPYSWMFHRHALYGCVTAQSQPWQRLSLLAWSSRLSCSSSKRGPRDHGCCLSIGPTPQRHSQISSTELCFGGLARSFSSRMGKTSSSRTCTTSMTACCLNHWNVDLCNTGHASVSQTSISSHSASDETHRPVPHREAPSFASNGLDNQVESSSDYITTSLPQRHEAHPATSDS
jgi:hypothetical protein